MLALSLGLAAGACATPQSDAPDLILTGGVVYALGAAEAAPASAVAIRGSTIVAVGDDATIRALAGDDTQEMPLDGYWVLPGFTDAWVDPEALGRWDGAGLDLRLASTPEEVQAMVRNAAPAAVDGWLLGWGWDETGWPQPRLPDHRLLDGAAPGRKVVLYRRSGRVAWLDRAALAACGIDDGTPDPTGGRILRDAEGRATGVLIGTAVDLVDEALPTPAGDTRRAWITAGLQQLAASGTTRLMSSPVDGETARLYLRLADEGSLPVRVDLRLQPGVDLAAATSRADRRGLLRMAAVGLTLDGPLAAHLAALEEPYADDPAGGDLAVLREAALDDAVRRAETTGLPLHVQAHGDAAVQLALSAASPAMLVGADLLPQPPPRALSAADTLVIALAPLRFSHDVYWLDERLGPDRASRAHAWRDLAEAGAPLAVGSDAPSYPLQPLVALHALLRRQDAQGYPAGGWHPEQGLDPERALRALVGPAASSGEPVLAPGAAADLVVWSEDPLGSDPEVLVRSQALLTIVAGRVTFTRPLVDLPMGTSP